MLKKSFIFNIHFSAAGLVCKSIHVVKVYIVKSFMFDILNTFYHKKEENFE